MPRGRSTWGRSCTREIPLACDDDDDADDADDLGDDDDDDDDDDESAPPRGRRAPPPPIPATLPRSDAASIHANGALVRMGTVGRAQCHTRGNPGRKKINDGLQTGIMEAAAARISVGSCSAGHTIVR